MPGVIEEHAPTPEAIDHVIHLSERDDVTGQQARLNRERKDIDKRIARLVEAIETGGDVPSLIAKVRTFEARKEALLAEVVALQPVPRLPSGVLENRLAEWRRLLGRAPRRPARCCSASDAADSRSRREPMAATISKAPPRSTSCSQASRWRHRRGWWTQP